MSTPERNKLDAVLSKVMSVSHDELMRREEQWKKEQLVAKKKRKPKTSASGRASSGKG
jgi:hypothetical protein